MTTHDTMEQAQAYAQQQATRSGEAYHVITRDGSEGPTYATTKTTPLPCGWALCDTIPPLSE